MYSFETDPEYQAKLDWAAEFVATEVEPLDHVFPNPFDRDDDAAMAAIVDGPTEVHEATVAKQLLAEYEPTGDLFPSGHLPKLRDAALEKLGAAAHA